MLVSSLLYGIRAILALNLPAFKNNKIRSLWPFSWKRCVWQDPDQKRTNKNARIYLKTTLPYNNKRLFFDLFKKKTRTGISYIIIVMKSFSKSCFRPPQASDLKYYLLKALLITGLGAYNKKRLGQIFFILSTFDKYGKTQLLTKFKNIL